ncbi:hypothetical protein CRG98_021421, partial [Punica granatum]
KPGAHPLNPQLAHSPAPQLTLETRSSILHPNSTCSSTISLFDINRVGFIFLPDRRGRVRVGPRPGAQPVASSRPARPNPTWPSPVQPQSNCPLASARLGPVNSTRPSPTPSRPSPAQSSLSNPTTQLIFKFFS